jgi:hypothetical protein
MEFFVLKDGERLGPYTRKELKERIAEGKISAHDRAWNIGRPDWKPVTRVMAASRAPETKDSKFWVFAALIVLVPAMLFYLANLRRPSGPTAPPLSRLGTSESVEPSMGSEPERPQATPPPPESASGVAAVAQVTMADETTPVVAAEESPEGLSAVADRKRAEAIADLSVFGSRRTAEPPTPAPKPPDVASDVSEEGAPTPTAVPDSAAEDAATSPEPKPGEPDGTTPATTPATGDEPPAAAAEQPGKAIEAEPETVPEPSDPADYSLRIEIDSKLKTIESSTSSTERDYLRSMIATIRLTNLGHDPAGLEVEWLFFSRPVSGIGRTVFNRGSERVEVSGGSWKSIVATSAPVQEGWKTVKGKRQDTGRKIEGCIVRAKAGGQVLLAKGSTDALDAIAADPSLLDYFLEAPPAAGEGEPAAEVPPAQ